MTAKETQVKTSTNIGPAGFFARFNWGWRIGIVYTCFVVFMLSLVYASTQMKGELVTADYYKDELNYQEHINKVNRTARLSNKLEWKAGDGNIGYTFPSEVAKEKISADVYFYCPSNSRKDKILKLETSDGTGMVNTNTLQKGVYQMKVEWQAGGEAYFNEGVITIN